MIERAKSYRRIKAIAPDWDLVVSGEIYYLIETEQGNDVGVIVFHPCDSDGLLMHVELGKECRGARAATAYRNAFNWMFSNTDHKTLLGRIPADNAAARFMARAVGGVFSGVDGDGLRCYSVSRSDFKKVSL